MRRVVLCLPEDAARVDPAPEETTKRDVELAFTWDGSPAGVVGYAEAGIDALELAAAHPDLVDRLVLVSTPVPQPGRALPAPTSAKVLLLFGSRDGGNARATWWKERLGGRIEMLPGESDDILQLVWPRVLSHVAPGALRK